MAKTMLELFEAARRASAPIITLRTADQADTQATIAEHSERFPVVAWDAVQGMRGVNENGQRALSKEGIEADETISFVEAMVAAQRLPKGAIVLAHNAHRQLISTEPKESANAVQAVSNLRDVFKKNYRTVVLLAPALAAPPELTHDVVPIDHALPGDDELKTIITQLHASAKIKAPTADALTKGADAVGGLSVFAAETSLAMSLTEDGLDYDSLWDRKREYIEQTPGMSVWRGKEKFDDLVGLDNIKAHLRNRMKARTPVGVVVVIDEIDKVLANVEGDQSGTKTDQMRTLLTEMENNEWFGLVAAGMPGGGKTAVAKAFANEAGVPGIMLDLAGMESKYVGESEAQLRHAMQVIKAVGRGHAYFIATSNAMTKMRPELQRRFTDNVWFFDLLTAEERAAAWKFYMKKYELAAQKLPDADGWTGAEIRNCCRYAWDVRCTLVEASKFVVPMARSRADEVERLRQFAHEKCLDATRPGTYTYTREPMVKQVRAVALPRSIAEMHES